MITDRGLGWLLPGLPQLRRGRALEGAVAMALWGGLVVLAIVRRERVAGAATDGVEGWAALLTLFLALGGLWYRSFGVARDRWEGGGRESVSGARFRGSESWISFRRNRLALLGLFGVGAACLLSLLTPLLAPFDPLHQEAYQGGELALRLAAPSAGHLLGTDQLGRDVLSRVLYGARISLSIGLLAVGISVSVGTVLGAVAGYLGGWVDSLIMRFTDVVMAFPRIVLLIILAALFRPSLLLIVMALALTQWPFTTRIVRGEILSLRQREFAEAAVALGFSRRRIIFRHLLPNAMAPIIVLATLGIGNTIVLEAGLSFLGLGVRRPTPSWGTMVADGMGPLVEGAWWGATFPGLAIVLVVLAFNLVGDGLRDALDPRQAGSFRT